MDHVRVDPLRCQDPKFLSWTAKTVYELLLDVCAICDGYGHIPAERVDVGYLVQISRLTPDDLFGGSPSEFIRKGLAQLREVGRVREMADGGLFISAWPKWYRPRDLSTPRVQKHRANLRAAQENETGETDFQRSKVFSKKNETPETRYPHTRAGAREHARGDQPGVPLREGEGEEGESPPDRRRPGRPRKPPDARFTPLREALEAVWLRFRPRPYTFDGGKDGKAVEKLLRLSGGLVAEVLRRWEIALAVPSGYYRVYSLAVFASRFDAYAEPPPEPAWESRRRREREDLAPSKPPPPPPQPATPAGQVWSEVLELLRADGKSYALEWISRMRAVALEGSALTLELPDAYFRDWVLDHYSGLLDDACSRVHSDLQLRYAVAAEAERPPPVRLAYPLQGHA